MMDSLLCDLYLLSLKLMSSSCPCSLKVDEQLRLVYTKRDTRNCCARVGLFYDQGRSPNSRSLRKCRATVARGATCSLFACVSRGLPGHLRCGISISPKTQVKCSDFKHVVACLLAVGCRQPKRNQKFASVT